MDWNCIVAAPSFSVVTVYAGLAVPVVTVGGAVVPVELLKGCTFGNCGFTLPVNAVPPNADLFPKRLLPPPNALVEVDGCPKADVVLVVAGCPNADVPDPNVFVPPENAPKPVAGFGPPKTLVPVLGLGLVPNVPGGNEEKRLGGVNLLTESTCSRVRVGGGGYVTKHWIYLRLLGLAKCVRGSKRSEGVITRFIGFQ